MTDAEEPWLAEALGSVLAQTLRPAEIILLVESSNMWLERVLSLLHSDLVSCSHITVIRTELAPLGAIRNLGVAHSNHDWVAFIDGDDLWYEDKLAEQAKAILERPEADFFGTDYVFVNSKGAPFGFSNGSTPTPSSWVVKRQLMVAHPFDGEIRVGEDHLWLNSTRRISTRVRVPRILVGYRIRGSSLSSLQAGSTKQRKRRELAARCASILPIRLMMLILTFPRYYFARRSTYEM